MHRLTIPIAFLLGIAAACADIPDPNHCWNLQRDATCRTLYDGDPVCSPCTRGFSGCVDRDHAPACLDVENDAESTDSSSSEESSG